ncbi:MAG TPA: MFS transporter [Opitutaceae bacterium]|nr:MFS transporter [Opitutaceae bacterium]
MNNATAIPAEKTRQEDKVSWGEKLAFGIGFLPGFYGIAGVGSFAIPVYQMTLRLDPVLLGVALSVPRFLDAIIDPIVGKMSDNTHSRWGRRRPYIAIGAVLQAIFFGTIWMVPTGWTGPQITAYLIATQLFFYVAYSTFFVPLNSLGYEMTPDYQERTRVWAFSTYFNKIGELSYSWVFPLTTLAVFTSVMQGVQIVGWIVAVLVLGVLGVLPALFVKERYFQKAVKQEKVRIWPAVKASVSNRSFMILIGLTALQIGAGMLASNIDQYLIVYNMFGGDVTHGYKWKAILSSSYAVVGIVSIPFVTWLANRYGKHITLSVTFVMVLLGAVGKWVLYTPGTPWKILLDPLLCGPVWVAIWTLTPAMLADICDEDELRHGLRREGVFGALFTWIQKIGYSFGFLGAMITLKLTGFNAASSGGVQASETLRAMRFVLAGSTAAWAVLALVLLALYPLTRKRAYEIRDALEARRGRI